MPNFRTEKDTLGTKQVPAGAYYGIETARAAENFPISGLRSHPYLIKAYALVKQAAAETNMAAGALDKKIGKAIAQAASEVAAGKFADQFIIDAYQAGAGTSTNMNLNEVIANRALEILGKPKGSYDIVSSHDHTNMSQSTNDTYPTTAHVAALWLSHELVKSLEQLAAALEKKSKKFEKMVKPGRTHLMDALPVTLGQEFSGYSTACRKHAVKIKNASKALEEVPLGGTATGTGVNTPKNYRKNVVKSLAKLSKLSLKPSRNGFEGMQSQAALVGLSGSLKALSTDLIKIANDLRLLSSGPLTGLAEVSLPAVQPGSSIMPGKVNPSMAEMLNMVCFQVIGNDTASTLAAQAGQLEINVFTPIAAQNLLHSLEILKNSIQAFTSRCVAGIEANQKRSQELAEKSVAIATVLSPKIGYNKAAQLVNESLKTGKSVRELAVAKGIISEKEAAKIFDLLAMTKAR